MNKRKSLLLEVAELIDRRIQERMSAEVSRPNRQRFTHRLLRWFIPNGGTLLIVAMLLMTQTLWAKPFAAPNAPGPSATTVNYQGHLADPDGNPLDGAHGMSFALYDAAADGNLVWGPEEHTAVEVSDGLFSVGLGSKTSGGIPTTTWNGDRYLEITVGGETLEPRELIRSVPIAGMALTVPDGALAESSLGFKNIFFTESWDDREFNPDVTNTTWDESYVKGTRHIFMAQKPAGTNLYCRLLSYVHAPDGESIDVRWGGSTVSLIEVSSNNPEWAQVDSGWVNLNSNFSDESVRGLQINARVSSGSGELSRSTLICAYGP